MTVKTTWNIFCLLFKSTLVMMCLGHKSTLVMMCLEHLSTLEQSPSWKANTSFSSQEITCILWNLEVCYHVYSSLPPLHILNQMNPVCTLPFYFFNIQLNVIILSVHRLSKGSLHIGFPHQTSMCISLLSHVCPPALSIWVEQCMLCSFSCTLPQLPSTSAIICPNT